LITVLNGLGKNIQNIALNGIGMDKCSVIIPTYNENENIIQLIDRIKKIFQQNSIDGEIVIVDDNSPDSTGQIVEKLSKRYNNLKIVHRKQRLGIFSAIKIGCRNALYDLILTMDSDLSHPPELIPILLSVREDADIVVASRFVKGGSMKGSAYRVIISKMINKTIRFLLNSKIRDLTGGFQLMSKSVLNKLDINAWGGEYDIELLIKAERRGFKIVEVPFTYTHRKYNKSKTSIFKDGFRYLKTILRLTYSF
jgi:dolichol-phosphate mannosyltransferase